jgi:hypothetical protein
VARVRRLGRLEERLRAMERHLQMTSKDDDS